MGLLEKLETDFKSRIFNKTFEKYGDHALVPIVDFDDCAWYIHQRQKIQLDSSLAVLGENGIGKSMCALGLLKKIKLETDPNWTLKDTGNVIYAHQGHRDFINAINSRKNDTILIDEANTIFQAKDHATTESRVCYTFVEVARKKGNALIYCTKNYGGLNYSLRSGKISMIVQIIDREDTSEEKALACVFMASAVMQSEDRFGLEQLAYARGWSEWKILVEQCHSFVGIMPIPSVDTILSKEEIDIYDKAKDDGIDLLAKKSMERMEAKEQMNEMRTEMYKRRMAGYKKKDKEPFGSFPKQTEAEKIENRKWWDKMNGRG